MNHTVQFSVRVVPGEFELVYRILGEEGSEGSDPVVLVYPSQAEMQDDLRGAHLPVSLSVVGSHEPMEVSDEQLRMLGREDTQDYR